MLKSMAGCPLRPTRPIGLEKSESHNSLPIECDNPSLSFMGPQLLRLRLTGAYDSSAKSNSEMLIRDEQVHGPLKVKVQLRHDIEQRSMAVLVGLFAGRG